MRIVCPLNAVTSKVLNVYPVVSLRFENVASVASTVLLEFRTWTCKRSKTVVVVVSADEILSQKLNVAEFAVDGMVICWNSESVCVTP